MLVRVRSREDTTKKAKPNELLPLCKNQRKPT
jgi:hypothetical protein